MVKGTVVIDRDRCKGCSLCVTFCPQHVLSIDKTTLNAKGYHPALLSGDGCTGCNNCALICPDVCFTVFREPVAASRALKEA